MALLRFALVAPKPGSYTVLMAGMRSSAAGFMVAAMAVSLALPADAGKRGAAGKRVVVEDILATPDGKYVVVLKTRTEPFRFVPIWIGENEAMAIRMRLDRRTPPRPLTLNLLESVMASSKIQLVEVRVDAIKGGVFLGKLRLKKNGRSWEIDARPSDAIGLAVGSDAVIWVAQQVLDHASFSSDDLLPGTGKKPVQPEEEPAPAAPDPKTTDLEETL